MNAPVRDLSTFFAPRSIAVVGAGGRATSSGGAVMQMPQRAAYGGRVVPVNPKGGTIFGYDAVTAIAAIEPPLPRGGAQGGGGQTGDRAVRRAHGGRRPGGVRPHWRSGQRRCGDRRLLHVLRYRFGSRASVGSWSRPSRSAGSRRGSGGGAFILSNSGGPGVLCADRASLEGLELGALPQVMADALLQQLPPDASTANPIDLLANAREAASASPSRRR